VQELDFVPEGLIVIGAGYVGVEFAQLLSRLGAGVTLLQRGRQLLLREDADIAEAVMKILEEDGVKVRLESEALSVDSGDETGFVLNVRTKEKDELIRGSHILFATGRVPNTESLNLKAAGIEMNTRGYIVANAFLETSAPNIYALGDVKGPPAFTHISYDDFRIIRGNLLSSSPPVAKLSTTGRFVPYVVYTDPQLGHVGLHENEARKQFPGKNIKTAKMPMSYVARALETDESRGLMKAVVDGDSGQILGFTCLGIEGGEVMAVVQMAMMGGMGYQKLQDAIWAHPSLAESLNNLWDFLE
jgi:pyruvate/2-oxoglutarate dehydrogenase complex dihydrolipoamide dehydrogenase (E3) component